MKRALLALLVGTLGGCSRDGPDTTKGEIATREHYVKDLLDDAGASRAWGVSSHADVQFDEGFSMIMYDPPSSEKRAPFHNHAFRWMGQHAHVRLKTHGDRRMKITVGGWVHENVIRSKPVIQLFVDGYYLATTNIIEPNGHYVIDQVVPDWMLGRPWVDLVIKTNAIGFHWADPPDINTVLVYRFAWSEAP